jgi:uncharacterized membrane protein
MMMAKESSREERILAGLAYFFGLIPALVIWVFRRKDSPYVGFHAMQAALIDGIIGLIALVFGFIQSLGALFLGIIAWLVTNIVADVVAPGSPLIFAIISLIFVLMVGTGMGLSIVVILSLKVFDIVAMVSALMGRDWHIPVLGNWAERFNHDN